MMYTAQDCTVVRCGPFGKTVVMECPSPQRAQTEAARMGREYQVCQRLASVQVVHHYGQRRAALRYFENEDIHG